MTWCEALEFVRTANGITAALGVVLSVLLEYWPAFGTLKAKIKRLVVMGICLALPLAALGAAWASKCVTQPDGELVWQAILAGGVAFASSQFAHLPKLEE